MHKSVMAVIHPDDRTSVDQAIKQTLEEGMPFEVEFRVIHPANHSVHILAGRAELFRNAAGQPEQLVGVNWDITQRKQLEEERFQALKRAEEEGRRRAEEAERHRKEQEEFIDTMCHEIRNPMTGVFGHIDYLNEVIASLNRIKETLPLDVQSSLTELIQKLEESTHTIKKCVEHQKTIVDDVLDVSKLEAGKFVLSAKPFQPKSVIEEIITFFATQLAAKHLELNLSLPEATLTVLGDSNRFKIILINLISNALKFTERGYIKISLQTQEADATHVALTFSVEDTGIGMTPDEQSRLFQRFSRPLSSQYEGSGLGLVITQKSLKLMGGDIQVDSKKGQGTRFTCHLTCETVPEQAKISPAVSKLPPAVQPAPVSKHILVVEDNLVNQRILKRQIEQAGHRCTVANNGQEALNQTEKTPFDLIFMDIEMPVMGGLEATRNIRAREKQGGMAETPIIGLSAYARPEHKEEARQAGMNDYLTNPYEKEKIYAAIQGM
jgi:signal transduction histidine kinase/CheY-like chemotaxis protein